MTKTVPASLTSPATVLTSPATVSPLPSRNRTFAPDGADGWREVTTTEEMRAVAQRILRAAYGLYDPEYQDPKYQDPEYQAASAKTEKAPVAVSAAPGHE